MDTSKRRRTITLERDDSDWPPKAIPSFDSTLIVYPWSYGPAAVLQERSTIRQLLELAHSIRMPNLKWAVLPGFCSSNGIGLLGMRVTVDEAFIDSEAKRNTLVDRAHEHFNTTWKLEVQAITATANEVNEERVRQRMRFVLYEKTEEHLYETVDKIDNMRSLYGSLKPETINLVRRCSTTNEIRRSMVMPTEVASFLHS
jgi:hypothetical protein